MGRRKTKQEHLFPPTARGGGHRFYEALNNLLDDAMFDAKVEALCAPHDATDKEPGTAACCSSGTSKELVRSAASPGGAPTRSSCRPADARTVGQLRGPARAGRTFFRCEAENREANGEHHAMPTAAVGSVPLGRCMHDAKPCDDAQARDKRGPASSDRGTARRTAARPRAPTTSLVDQPAVIAAQLADGPGSDGGWRPRRHDAVGRTDTGGCREPSPPKVPDPRRRRWWQ